MVKPTSINLAELTDEVEEIMQEEGYANRSEFIRALIREHRRHRMPSDHATKEEIVAIDRGREAFARGEYVTLDQLEREVDIIR